MINRYYILNGTEIQAVGIEDWITWYEQHKRKIAETFIGNIRISTVFLGIDHNFDTNSNIPILFETMVFGGELNGEAWRYATYVAAKVGHEKVVDLVVNKDVNWSKEGF